MKPKEENIIMRRSTAEVIYGSSIRRASEKLFKQLEKDVSEWKRRQEICVDTYELGFLMGKETSEIDEDISDKIGKHIIYRTA